MRQKSKTRDLPPIFISAEDHETLSRLVGDIEGDGPVGLLQLELDRAIICEEGELPPLAIGLNRWLHYVDDRRPEARRVRIVLPQDADIDSGSISALSYVGSGLIGLTEGRSIEWPDQTGAVRKLTPILVEEPALA